MISSKLQSSCMHEFSCGIRYVQNPNVESPETSTGNQRWIIVAQHTLDSPEMAAVMTLITEGDNRPIYGRYSKTQLTVVANDHG
ncbi:hypothetical protein E3N88_27026 [Mikania micrantha]|uniref:Uncharacterized protein n=1 Tax=Mikania micrantha TaxID=192012 RepID=A0A5N6MYC8_9ASTR|nr:hypothetical protein E3N88_27026 [Mikania micrantha]